MVRAVIRAGFRRARYVVLVVVVVATIAAGAGVAVLRGTHRSIDPAASVRDLRVVNYYPAAHPFEAMWLHFDARVVSDDFLRIRKLGANAVRIIVQPTAVGYPNLSRRGRAELAAVSRLAQSQHLAVQLTLFDHWGLYAQRASSTKWLRQVSGAFAPSSVALVELQSEIDPGSPSAMAWARSLLPAVRAAFPGKPRTLSVAGKSGARGVSALLSHIPSSLLDVVDVHLYGSVGQAVAVLDTARRLAGRRPVFIGETGRTASPDVRSEQQAQAAYFTALGAISRRWSMPAPAPWMLNDFTATAHAPAKDNGFGLFTATGQPKLAVAAVRTVFRDAGQAPAACTATDIDGGFEREQDTPGSTLFGTWRAANTDLAQRIGITTDGARTGHAAAIVTGTQQRSDRTAGVYDSLPVTAAGAVTVRAWVRLIDGHGVTNVALSWYDVQGRYLGQARSLAAWNTSSAWQQIRVTSAPPTGAVELQIHLQSAGNPGSAIFDDVTVTGISAVC